MFLHLPPGNTPFPLRALSRLVVKIYLPVHARPFYLRAMKDIDIDQLIQEARDFALTHNEALDDSILYGGHDAEIKRLLERATLERLFPGIDPEFADIVATYVHAARAFRPGIVTLTPNLPADQRQEEEARVTQLKKDYDAALQAYEERKEVLLPLQRQIIQWLTRQPYPGL